jgi:hypothetical protein
MPTPTPTPLPLNKFRLIAKKLVSGSNNIYQEDIDVASIILSSQVTNVTGSVQFVDVLIQKSGSVNTVMLLKDGAIPPNESLNPFAGKVVLERNDALLMRTVGSGSLEVVLSVLENANN